MTLEEVSFLVGTPHTPMTVGRRAGTTMSKKRMSMAMTVPCSAPPCPCPCDCETHVRLHRDDHWSLHGHAYRPVLRSHLDHPGRTRLARDRDDQGVRRDEDHDEVESHSRPDGGTVASRVLRYPCAVAWAGETSGTPCLHPCPAHRGPVHRDDPAGRRGACARAHDGAGHGDGIDGRDGGSGYGSSAHDPDLLRRSPSSASESESVDSSEEWSLASPFPTAVDKASVSMCLCKDREGGSSLRVEGVPSRLLYVSPCSTGITSFERRPVLRASGGLLGTHVAWYDV